MQNLLWPAYEVLHGGHGSEGGGAFGSDPLIIASTLLHSLGAIAWAGGIVALISWARELWQGHHGAGTWRLAQAGVWGGMAANFLGGTIRLFEPGHPELAELGSDTWVQLIFAKHVILVGAVGVSVYLMGWGAPALLRAFRGGTDIAAGHQRARLLAIVVILCILAATVLGASSTVALPEM